MPRLWRCQSNRAFARCRRCLRLCVCVILDVPKDHQDIHNEIVKLHVVEKAQEDAVGILENNVNPYDAASSKGQSPGFLM